MKDGKSQQRQNFPPSPQKEKEILEQKHTISEMTNSLDRLKNRMKRGEEVSELEDTPIEIIQFF